MVGVGMSGRGAVELIVAGVAMQAGLFLQPSPTPVLIESLFSAIIIMAVVTTVPDPEFPALAYIVVMTCCAGARQLRERGRVQAPRGAVDASCDEVEDEFANVRFWPKAVIPITLNPDPIRRAPTGNRLMMPIT